MSREIPTLRHQPLHAALLILLAGCGGGDGGGSNTVPPTSNPGPDVSTCPDDIEAADIQASPVSAAACAAENFDTYTDLVYASHARGLLDLMIPRDATDPLPLVVWIHGGGWQSGDKSNRAQATRLLCRGYAVAAINYRLSDTSTFPAQIHDVKAAIRFLRANASGYGLDAARIAVFGSSAGGHLAALAGTSAGVGDLEDVSQGSPGISSRVQAVVDWYGPTHFADMDYQLLAQACAAGNAHHSDADSAESRLLGCTVGEATCASAVERADPASYADSSDPPMLLLHGSADCTVPLAQSTWLREQMNAAGACAVQRTVVDAGHGGPSWTSAEVQDALAEFLDRVLE